jgi:hypothetical protein
MQDIAIYRIDRRAPQAHWLDAYREHARRLFWWGVAGLIGSIVWTGMILLALRAM